MKKMIFQKMDDQQKMMNFFEKHNIKYSWDFMNKNHELHLGATTEDQIKAIMRDTGMKIAFKWGDYYW